MRSGLCFVVAGAIAGVSPLARAQDQAIASLPFLGGQTAGPNGTNYEPPMDDHDLWIIEDFGISSAANLTRFESRGTIFPAPLILIDLTVRIYDAMPPDGHIILSSVPGSGRMVVSGQDEKFTADFGGQFLPAGNYFVVWQASTHTNNNQIAIFWAQGGPHAVGLGGPDNAWKWNPGGGWGWMTPNNIKPVPADLSGNGQTGVNFTIYGRPGCYANCDGSSVPPILNVSDFVCFQSHFAAGDPYANCDGSTVEPVLNISDFICFMNTFAGGCP